MMPNSFINDISSKAMTELSIPRPSTGNRPFTQQLIPPRPATRQQRSHRPQFITCSSSNVNRNIFNVRKREPSIDGDSVKGLLSSKGINSGQGEYLYMRMIRRNLLRTNTLLSKNENKIEEPQTEFVRSGKARATTGFKIVHQHKAEQKQQQRPSTTQSLGDKGAYFDDLASGPEALKSYKMMSHIGKGAFSVVSLAIGKENKCNYAIKTYQKIDALDWNRLAYIKREIKHLSKLDSSRVVRFVDLVRERKKLHLVLENGGRQSLAGIIRKDRTLSQSHARKYFRQVVEGVAYIHQKGICHRDLKPENILVDELGDIKLIDFGFSASSRNTLSNFCGTPAFMCPQLVKKVPYNGGKADVWALGVMLYYMLVGFFPFRASNQAELNRLIMNGKYRYRDQGAVSGSAKKFIARMLQVKPQNRPQASDLLNDNWLS